MATLYTLAEEIRRKGLHGNIAELGVYKGDFANHISTAFSNRHFYLFDTFEGYDERDVHIELMHGYSKTARGELSNPNMNIVMKKLKDLERCHFIKGYFPDSLEAYSIKDNIDKFVFVSLDVNLYQPTYEGLKFFYPKMVKGGFIMIHDYQKVAYSGVMKAVDAYCKEMNISVLPIFDFGGSALIVK